MAVWKLVCVGSGGQRQDLITKTNAKDRLSIRLEQHSQVSDEGLQVLWIAGAVADHNPVCMRRQLNEIGVPGRADYAYAAGKQRPHDVVFRARVDQQNGKSPALVIDRFARRDE